MWRYGIKGGAQMKWPIAVTLAMVLTQTAACGDKVPESKAAKEIGNIPKQTVDKAAGGVDKALTQAAERVKDDADQK